MAQQNTLQKKLKELGSKLLKAPVLSNSLVKLLKQTASCLSEIEQYPPKSVLDSMKPCISVMVKDDYLNHQDKDVRVPVATSICEIMRITAPEPPYSDDVLRDAFHLIVSTFYDLEDKTSPSFGRRVAILETLAKYRSCVVMLDIECDDLVNEMFSLFLSSARDDYPDCVLMSMQTIMSLLLDESEVVQEDLVLLLLATLGHGESDEPSAARRLAMNVIENCAEKLEACITRTLNQLYLGKKVHQMMFLIIMKLFIACTVAHHKYCGQTKLIFDCRQLICLVECLQYLDVLFQKLSSHCFVSS